MKKSTVIVSCVMLCLALIGLVVGVTAAWFGNVGSLSNTITISSERPTGQAIVDVEAMINTSDAPINGVLSPAIVKAGYLQDPLNISAWNAVKGEFSKNPLGDTYVDAAGEGTASQPLTRAATSVTVTFPFAYIGAADDGKDDKAVKISVNSAKLTPPKEESGSSDTTDYVGEFGFRMRLIEASYDSNKRIDPVLVDGKTVENTSVPSKQTDNVLGLLIYPGVDYFFEIEIYFAKVDEECPLALRSFEDKFRIYFNIGVEATNRTDGVIPEERV